MQLEIHQQKAIEFLLRKHCKKDMEKKYPWGPHDTNDLFLKWLLEKGFISQEHFDIQMENLRKEEE